MASNGDMHSSLLPVSTDDNEVVDLQLTLRFDDWHEKSGYSQLTPYRNNGVFTGGCVLYNREHQRRLNGRVVDLPCGSGLVIKCDPTGVNEAERTRLGTIWSDKTVELVAWKVVTVEDGRVWVWKRLNQPHESFSLRQFKGDSHHFLWHISRDGVSSIVDPTIEQFKVGDVMITENKDTVN